MSERVVVIRTPDGELPACFMPKTVDLVGEGCPYRSVQQFAYELLNLAQPGQLPAGFVERAIQAAQLLDPALLSSGSNP